MRAAGILDNDPYMKGRQIHGIEVLGNYDDLKYMIESKKIDGVIFSNSAQLDADVISDIISTCEIKNIWAKELRFEFETVVLTQ